MGRVRGVAAAMGQVASAFPTAGGLYHWASVLGGRGWGWATAWFNLAGLMAERGRTASARRHLQRAIALDPGYGDAVYNLASLEFEAGNLGEARRWWERYLELDRDSEWARTAARGVLFVRQAGLAPP